MEKALTILVVLALSFVAHVYLRASTKGPVDFWLVKERPVIVDSITLGVGLVLTTATYEVGGLKIKAVAGTPAELRLLEAKGKTVSIILRIEE